MIEAHRISPENLIRRRINLAEEIDVMTGMNKAKTVE
jgi:hypothetical protein